MVLNAADIPGMPSSQSCRAAMETSLWGLNTSTASSADLESPHDRAGSGKADGTDLGKSVKKLPQGLGHLLGRCWPSLRVWVTAEMADAGLASGSAYR